MCRFFRVLAIALVLVLGAPAVAHAQRWHAADERGDVSGTRLDPDDSGCGYAETPVPAGPEPNEDIRAVTVQYSAKALRIGVRFQDLDPELDQFVGATVRGPERTWSVDVSRSETESGKFRTTAWWSRVPDRAGGCGYTVLVYRIKATVDLEGNRVIVTVPRRLLRDSRWLRVGVYSSRSFRTPDVEPTPEGLYSFTMYSDDWHASGALSPRIRRQPGKVG
jgi:hypothetical protein